MSEEKTSLEEMKRIVLKCMKERLQEGNVAAAQVAWNIYKDLASLKFWPEHG